MVIKCCTKRIIRNNREPLLSVWHMNHMMGVEDHTELEWSELVEQLICCLKVSMSECD